MRRAALVGIIVVLWSGGLGWGQIPGQVEVTLESLRVEAQAHPDSIHHWTRLADAQAWRGDRAAAVTTLHAVMSRVPLAQRKDEECLKLGSSLAALGRAEEALENLDRAVAMFGSRKQLSVHHGARLLACPALCGEPGAPVVAKAERLVAGLFPSRPQRLICRAIAGQVAYHANNAEVGQRFLGEAKVLLEEELAQEEPDVDAVLTYVDILLDRTSRRRGEHRIILHRLYEKRPDVDSVYRFNMMWAEMQANAEEAPDYVSAAAFYRRAVMLAPPASLERDRARYGLYQNLMSLGRFDEALAEAQAGQGEASESQRPAWQAVINDHAAKREKVMGALTLDTARRRAIELQQQVSSANARYMKLTGSGQTAAARQAQQEREELSRALEVAKAEAARLALAKATDPTKADALRRQICDSLFAQGLYDQARVEAQAGLAAAATDEQRAAWQGWLTSFDLRRQLIEVKKEVDQLQIQTRAAHEKSMADQAAESQAAFEALSAQLDAKKIVHFRLQIQSATEPAARDRLRWQIFRTLYFGRQQFDAARTEVQGFLVVAETDELKAGWQTLLSGYDDLLASRGRMESRRQEARNLYGQYEEKLKTDEDAAQTLLEQYNQVKAAYTAAKEEYDGKLKATGAKP